MRLQATADLSKFKGDMAQAIAAVRRGAEEGGDRAAQVVFNEIQRQKGKTYARSIPSSPSGRPLWARSGAWLEGTRISKPSRWVWLIHTVGKAVRSITNYPGGYEEKLSVLNSPRKNAASPNTVPIVRPQIPVIFENAINNALKFLRGR